MYLAFADQCGQLMQKYGVKVSASSPLPRMVLQHPAPQGQQPRFSVMKADFSTSALKQFLVQEGVAVPAGLGEGGLELVGAANGLEGCIEKFDKLATSFFTAGNPVLRAKILEDARGFAADEKGPAAGYYVKTMERIQAKGKKVAHFEHLVVHFPLFCYAFLTTQRCKRLQYVASEIARLDRMLKAGNLASEKKRSMTERKNILSVFGAAVAAAAAAGK